MKALEALLMLSAGLAVAMAFAACGAGEYEPPPPPAQRQHFSATSQEKTSSTAAKKTATATPKQDTAKTSIVPTTVAAPVTAIPTVTPQQVNLYLASPDGLDIFKKLLDDPKVAAATGLPPELLKNAASTPQEIAQLLQVPQVSALTNQLVQAMISQNPQLAATIVNAAAAAAAANAANAAGTAVSTSGTAMVIAPSPTIIPQN